MVVALGSSSSEMVMQGGVGLIMEAGVAIKIVFTLLGDDLSSVSVSFPLDSDEVMNSLLIGLFRDPLGFRATLGVADWVVVWLRLVVTETGILGSLSFGTLCWFSMCLPTVSLLLELKSHSGQV